MNMKRLFITATGTDAGKTYFTTALLRALRSHVADVFAIKPVASGVASLAESDTGRILSALGMEVNTANADKISPWRYAPPVSPHKAARGDASYSFRNVAAFCDAALAQHSHMLVEGAGGVLSPLTEKETMADLMAELRLPAVLVTNAYLGSLSHTLTAVEALLVRNIPLAHIVVNEGGISTLPVQEFADDLRLFLGGDVSVSTLGNGMELIDSPLIKLITEG